MNISIEKEKMKNKNYDLREVMLANIKGECSYYKGGFDKQDLKGSFREKLGVGSRKANNIFETLLELNVIVEKDDGLYGIQEVKAPFITLSANDVVFCIKNLSAIELKIYCYFLSFTWLFNNNHFTIKELAEVCGYSYSNRNCNMFKEALNHLEELELIIYTHENVYNFGGDGPKKVLCAVNKISGSYKF